MKDTEQIQAQYLRLCDGMIHKDKAMLDQILDDRVAVIHDSGLQQNKEDFVSAVLDGTLNYFSIRHESLPAFINGSLGILNGRAWVTAELFDRKRETLPLQHMLTLEKQGDTWKIIHLEITGF